MKRHGWRNWMRLREAIARAAQRLRHISQTPRLDAELLAAHALGIDRDALLLSAMDAPAPEGLEALVTRREAAEPIAYIVGTRDFWTIDLAVCPGVLVPRPDSETLIEAAVAHFVTRAPASILDLGTGSGALLLAALSIWPEARGLGIDASPTALDIARANAERLGLLDRSDFHLGDWSDGIDQRFDLILCNPPYIEADAALPDEVARHEPASALFAGKDGLDAYRALAPAIGPLMARDGLALFEIGATQADDVRALFAAHGHHSSVLPDLGGRDRCIAIDAILNRA